MIGAEKLALFTCPNIREANSFPVWVFKLAPEASYPAVSLELKLKLPPAVGVPLRIPVLGLIAMPGGRVLNGALPVPLLTTKLLTV